MKRLIGVFLLYLFTNILYLFVLNSSLMLCSEWNQVTNTFVLVVHLSAMSLSIFITKEEFKNLNQRFFARMISGLIYLILFYSIVQSQIFMLKC